MRAQGKRREALGDRVATAIAQADGFDLTLLQWRLETTTAAVRFIDTAQGVAIITPEALMAATISSHERGCVRWRRSGLRGW